MPQYLESDVSILIPTFNYASRVIDSVKDALATSAGEIIVSDDASHDGTIEILKSFNDPRLHIVEQSNNLGLWKNHLATLELASRPWIKFIQADDRLLPGALGRMVEAIGDNTTIVWSNPIFEDYDTCKKWTIYEFDRVMRFSPDELFNKIKTHGYELGSPTQVLLKKDTLDLSKEAWSNDKSCDIIMSLLAALKGETVFLPAGNIIQGLHQERDTMMQDMDLLVMRLINTLEYLNLNEDERLRQFLSVFGLIEGIGLFRTALGFMRRGLGMYSPLLKSVMRIFRGVKWKYIIKTPGDPLKMWSRKYGPRTGISV